MKWNHHFCFIWASLAIICILPANIQGHETPQAAILEDNQLKFSNLTLEEYETILDPTTTEPVTDYTLVPPAELERSKNEIYNELLDAVKSKWQTFPLCKTKITYLPYMALVAYNIQVVIHIL